MKWFGKARSGAGVSANRIFKATGAVMAILEKLINVKVITEGLEHLDERPTLFVVNHFTRMETFIVPYALYKHTGKEVHSLASATLFKGLLGEYLKKMGTMSVREPLRNRRIIGDLITNRYDWVIFPEGVMVKDKKVVRDGKFHLESPHRSGPPHTGAAILGLKAEMYRRHYLKASRKRNRQVTHYYEGRYNFAGLGDVSEEGVVIVPVNITFYPIRPKENLISRLASAFLGDMVPRIEEELKTEGSLLLEDTDMTIYFGKPIEVATFLKRPLWLAGKLLPFASKESRENIVLGTQKRSLTRTFMRAIYSNAAINFDHLFCMGLRKLRRRSVRAAHFHRAVYLSALTIREMANRRTHPSLGNDLVKIIADESFDPLESIRLLVEEQGALELRGNMYVVRHARLARKHDFHNVRLKNVTRVIANEIEPLKNVTGIIDRYVNTSAHGLREEIAERLFSRDVAEFEKDYEKYYEEGLSKSPSIGCPFFMKSRSSQTGIILCHGYLAAPEEVRPLAEFLHKAGYSVYAVRMRGFGTAPRQLLDVTWEDWQHSFNRAYAVVRNSCRNVILGGFSAGGLMALLNAALKKSAVRAVFCINTPLVLEDFKVHLVPAALAWNEVLEKSRLSRYQFDHIKNEAENPEINYVTNYLKGVRELSRLIEACRGSLDQVVAPCLAIQADKDPVVNPKSVDIIVRDVSSQIKKKIVLESDRHVIIRKGGSEQVFDEVLEFVNTIRGASVVRSPLKALAAAGRQ